MDWSSVSTFLPDGGLQPVPVDSTMTGDAQMASGLPQVEAIAREAGSLLRSYFQSTSLKTEAKGYLDVVTQADKECEELVVGRLKTAFPGDAIVGEEGTKTESQSGRCWYIDPLDGTFNFSRGIPFWCVSIGLVDEQGFLEGVVFDPLRDEMFSAVRGKGAWLNGAPIKASTATDPMSATLQLTVNFDREVIETSIRDFNAVARSVMRMRNIGALALELAYVACGRLDAVSQRGSHPWDYAAGILLCTEAGATVTDMDGTEFDLARDDALVASTGELHQALVEMFATG